jgi:hypothetical protein
LLAPAIGRVDDHGGSPNSAANCMSGAPRSSAMTIPRDQLVDQSNLILAQFIDAASNLGMPVNLLRRVRSDYTIKFKRGDGDDHVSPFWNDLVLYETTVNGLKQPGSRWADAVSVQTLYHEATHAIVDIDDVDDNGLFKSAVFEYDRAKLVNGKRVDDPDRVAQEAAGCYVGHRAASAWQIFQKIEFWMSVLDQHETGKMTAARARELFSMTTQGVSIPEYYERLMRERIFGYQEVGSGQVSVNYPIPNLLRVYCDSVLENKILDNFAHMTLYTSRYDALKQRLAKLGLPEKP